MASPLIIEKPFRHVRLLNFLPESLFSQLQKDLAALPFEKKESDLFTLSQTPDLRTNPLPSFLAFRERMLSLEMKSFVESLCGKKVLSDIDLAASKYGPTDFLLCHDDLLEERIVAYTYYLNDMSEGSGGELCLYEGGKSGLQVKKRIVPKANSLVLFVVSKKSFHSVAEILKGERLSLQGWYKRKSSLAK